MPEISQFKALKAHVRQRMAAQLSPQLTYHSLAHTFDDVLPATERIADLYDLDDMPRMLLRTAALLHDIGFTVTRDNHEAAGVHIAQKLLPGYGYTPRHIDRIAGMIRATRIPQSPVTLLEQIIADADLDVLGRADFAMRNQDLRDELAAFDAPVSHQQWFTGQLRFMHSHCYFTKIRSLRHAQKQQNIAYLESHLKKSTST